MTAVIDRFKSFYAKPFRPDGTAGDWLLFVGLLLIAMILWRFVLGAINVTD